MQIEHALCTTLVNKPREAQGVFTWAGVLFSVTTDEHGWTEPEEELLFG